MYAPVVGVDNAGLKLEPAVIVVDAIWLELFGVRVFDIVPVAALLG